MTIQVQVMEKSGDSVLGTGFFGVQVESPQMTWQLPETWPEAASTLNSLVLIHSIGQRLKL